MRHAILEPKGYGWLAIDAILWDGKTDWSPPKGCIAVPCPGNVGAGWFYDGTTFVPSPEVAQNLAGDPAPIA
jgi:hypothetical protein